MEQIISDITSNEYNMQYAINNVTKFINEYTNTEYNK